MEFKEKIRHNLLSKGTKLRNKYPPISEQSDGQIEVRRIKNIFQLKEDFKDFYLIITKPMKGCKDKNYYLVYIIASQSSDFLSKIAKNLMSDEKNTRLIQFSFHPEHFRVSLALLRELDEFIDFNELKIKMISFKSKFLTKLNNIIN